MLTIDPTQVSVPVLHSYLQSAIAPRPIAFASTIDQAGQVNLSPFSFFNLFGTNPPILIFSPNRRVRDGSTKHTLENVLEVPEVTINMVDYAMVEQMSLASCEYPKGVNEFTKAGFTEAASDRVRPPRVAESKASFECKVLEVKQLGDAGGSANLVICEILLAHFDDSILDDQGRIDQLKTDWIARLGGDWYARASGLALFEVAKPNTKLGIGVDRLPADIRNSHVLTGNNLGQLANIEQLPSQEEAKHFAGLFPVFQNIDEQHHYAQQFLASDDVRKAWLVLLQNVPA